MQCSGHASCMSALDGFRAGQAIGRTAMLLPPSLWLLHTTATTVDGQTKQLNPPASWLSKGPPLTAGRNRLVRPACSTIVVVTARNRLGVYVCTSTISARLSFRGDGKTRNELIHPIPSHPSGGTHAWWLLSKTIVAAWKWRYMEILSRDVGFTRFILWCVFRVPKQENRCFPALSSLQRDSNRRVQSRGS